MVEEDTGGRGKLSYASMFGEGEEEIVGSLSSSSHRLFEMKTKHLSPLMPSEEVEVEEILFTQPLDESGQASGPIRLRASLANKEIVPIALQISEMVYVRTFVLLLMITGGFFLLYNLSSVVTPILFSLGLAYLINPIVVRMERIGMGRGTAILILVGLVVVVMAVGVMLLLPAMMSSVDELTRLVKRFPAALEKSRIWLESNFKFHFPTTWTEALSQWGDQIQKYAPSALKPLGQVVASIFSSSINLLIGIFNFLFIPLFTYYFLKDYKNVEQRLLKLIPPRMRDWSLVRFRELDGMISGFIRGQLTVCLIVGSMYMVLLTAVQVPLAPLIAVGGASINVIPYLGFLLTYVIAILAALVEYQFGWQFFVVLFGMFAIHMLDVFWFTPKVVGEHVGMSELVVIIAILAGGKLFGMVGILLAVPMAAVCKVLLREVMERYEGSRFFRGDPPSSSAS